MTLNILGYKHLNLSQHEQLLLMVVGLFIFNETTKSFFHLIYILIKYKDEKLPNLHVPPAHANPYKMRIVEVTIEIQLKPVRSTKEVCEQDGIE